MGRPAPTRRSHGEVDGCQEHRGKGEEEKGCAEHLEKGRLSSCCEEVHSLPRRRASAHRQRDQETPSSAFPVESNRRSSSYEGVQVSRFLLSAGFHTTGG